MDRQDGVHPNEELRDERCDLEQRNRGLRHLRLPVPVRRKDRRGHLHRDLQQPGAVSSQGSVELGCVGTRQLWGGGRCVVGLGLLLLLLHSLVWLHGAVRGCFCVVWSPRVHTRAQRMLRVRIIKGFGSDWYQEEI